MEASGKSVQVKGGPLGYVYARRAEDLETETVALLSAKSADDHTAVLPLLRSVTVERDFQTNVAAVSGSKTTGLGGSGSGVTAKLLPTHYSPCAFAFYGAGGIAPSVRAPNLTAACESSRERFGFSKYATPCQGAVETTGADICDALSLDPGRTALYLVVTESFREVVYLCNTYLFFGGAESVKISDGADSVAPWDPVDDADGDRVLHVLERDHAVRVPLYPINLATPDFSRVNTEPFNKKHRALGDGYEMPQAFFNTDLCRMLHGYVLGPAAVAMRVRNLDAVARGAAHLCFDETHEGVVLPNDVSFALMESERVGAEGPGGQGAPTGPSGGRGRKKPDTQAGDSSASSSGVSGLERRTASVMASDATAAMESLLSSSVYEETVCDPYEWPLFVDAGDDESDRVKELSSYLSRIAGLVGAMVFASNSALYMTDVEDAGRADGKEIAQPFFYRFYQVAAPHLAANPLVDREGRPVGGGNGGQEHAGRTGGGAGRRNGALQESSGHIKGVGGGYYEYQLDYLCMACGFCPHILAKMLFYLDRCDAGAAAYRYDSDALRHTASAIDSDVPCDLCVRQEKHRCVRTTMYRLRHRLPKFGNSQMRGAICLFGTATSNYSDTDPLGSYAPFSALKRVDGESSKNVIQDTYRVTAERLLAELDGAGFLSKDDPTDQSAFDGFIKDGKSFVDAISAAKSIAEREAAQLVHNLAEVRDFKIREGLADANHTLYLTVEPYSSGICPLLAFLQRRSMLAVIQDMALSQCSHLMHGQQVEARNFRTQFQAVLRKRVLEMQNAGFVSARPITVTLHDPGVALPDPTKTQRCPPLTDADADLVRVNVDVIKELKVKNRVMFFGASIATSDAARARAAGMAEAYQKQDRRTDVLSGALGFALKRYHHVLFPNGRPIGGCGASSSAGNSAAAAQWFWAMIQRNQMPARLLKKEDVDLIKFVKQYTDEYADGNFINVAPTCVAELAQFCLANALLRFCDHKNFFITTITALTAQARRPRDPSAVLSWIDDTVDSGADLEKRARDILGSVESKPRAWTSTFSASNMVRHAMAAKPMLVIGVSISKYQGISGSVRVFQAGNWGTIMGGKNVCALMGFDRTRRYVLSCPRVGFVAQRSVFSAGTIKEKTIADMAKSIIETGGAAPHAAVFCAALKAMGAKVRDLDEADWLSITEDPYMAAALCDINAAAEKSRGGWTVEAAEAAAREALDRADSCCAQNGEATFDFGACSEKSLAGGGFDDAGGLFYDDPVYDAGSGRAPGQDAPHQQKANMKRPFADPLFDMDPPPEKKSGLTADML